MASGSRFGFLFAQGIGILGTEPTAQQLRRSVRHTVQWTKEGATLYHYTDMQGLHGIISENGFRLSHIRYLNDAKEVLHGRDLAVSTLRKLLEKRRYDHFREPLQSCLTKLKSDDVPDYGVGCFSYIDDSL